METRLLHVSTRLPIDKILICGNAFVTLVVSQTKKSRWKLSVAIITLLLVGLLAVWIKIKIGNRKPPDPLAGFTIMNLPRRDVDIGAPWTQDIGPIRGSSDIPRLQNRSLQMSEISTVENVDASILGDIADSLHLTGTASDQARRTMKLKGITIVTVADASKLRSVAGNQYLWEGVRVDQLSIVSSRSAKAEASAKVKDLTEADSIEEKTIDSDSVELTANGSKLYVAYRVVTMSQPTLELIDVTPVSSSSSDVNLRSEYALHLAGRKGQTFFTKPCKIFITVSSYLVLDSNAHPTESAKIEVPCGGPLNQTYSIGSTTGSIRASIDSLQVQDMMVSPAADGGAQATGTFAIQRRTMQLETLKDPKAAGW